MQQDSPTFDYAAAADLYVGVPARAASAPARAVAAGGGKPRLRATSARRMTYRRFSTGAEAVRFIIEEQPAETMLAAAIESEGERFEGAAIRVLYDSSAYPLARRVPE